MALWASGRSLIGEPPLPDADTAMRFLGSFKRMNSLIILIDYVL